MKTKHFTALFVAPVFFYLSIALYFLSALSVIGSLSTDPGFLIIGLIMFILAYNAWVYGKTMKGSE